MKNRPQTIQIFLPDGSPTSIREAELTNRLVKAILFPRNKINEVAKRDMVHFTGVYFLFGNTEDGKKPLVYIGEGEDFFICKGKNALAEGEMTDDGFVVYKGGKCNKEETPGINKWIKTLRKELVDEGILIEMEKVYVFQSDYIFNSPSAAAAVILGRSANGWTSWKDKNGITLDELKRK